MSDQPGVDRPFGIDRPTGVYQPPKIPIRKLDVTLHHWNIITLAEGLKLIGWGLIFIAVAIVTSTVIIVGYLNGQS